MPPPHSAALTNGPQIIATTYYFGTVQRPEVAFRPIFPLSDRIIGLIQLPSSQSFGLLSVAKDVTGAALSAASNRNGKEREAYVCPNGTCKAMRLHLRRRAVGWRRNADRGRSGPGPRSGSKIGFLLQEIRRAQTSCRTQAGEAHPPGRHDQARDPHRNPANTGCHTDHSPASHPLCPIPAARRF